MSVLRYRIAVYGVKRLFRFIPTGGPGVYALLVMVFLGGVLPGCRSYSEKTESARIAASRGDFAGALQEYDELLELKAPEELPDSWKGNVPLLVLERATLLQAQGMYAASQRNFSAAESQLEVLDLANARMAGIASWIFDDSAKNYRTTPTEKLYLNALNMINYLAQGDLSGAKVEARRFSVMRQYLKDYDPEHAHGPLGSLLAGYTFEKAGDLKKARRYYDELSPDTEVSHFSPYIEKLSEAAKGSESEAKDAATGELLLIFKLGQVPYKEARRVPVGFAVGVAGSYFTGNDELLRKHAAKFVNYPELVPGFSDWGRPRLRIDDAVGDLEQVADVAGAIKREFDRLRPRIMAAALTRMLSRAAIGAGTEAGISAGSKEDNSVLAGVAALAVEGILAARDRPDTRSWTSLPAEVWVRRIALAPGKHRVAVEVFSKQAEAKAQRDVEIKAGEFVVVEMTVY